MLQAFVIDDMQNAGERCRFQVLNASAKCFAVKPSPIAAEDTQVLCPDAILQSRASVPAIRRRKITVLTESRAATPQSDWSCWREEGFFSEVFHGAKMNSREFYCAVCFQHLQTHPALVSPLNCFKSFPFATRCGAGTNVVGTLFVPKV